MKLTTLLTITAIISVFFALGFLLTPNLILGLYGVTTDGSGMFIARLVGAAGSMFAVLAWLARGHTLAEARRAIVPAFLIAFLLQTIVFAVGTITGVFNALGWVIVILVGLFTVAFAYMQFAAPSEPH
jgi:hypothetical protein